MKSLPLLVLIGESLLLDSVEANLSRRMAVDVIHLHLGSTEVASRLKTLDPDMIIFDLDAVSMQCLLPFIRTGPTIPMLGVDINSEQVVVMFCQHHAVSSGDELQRMILHYTQEAVQQFEVLGQAV